MEGAQEGSHYVCFKGSDKEMDVLSPPQSFIPMNIHAWPKSFSTGTVTSFSLSSWVCVTPISYLVSMRTVRT